MMRDLTPAQRMMVEDGLPVDLILSPEERARTWKGKRLKPTAAFAEKKPVKEEDPATREIRKEIAAAEERKKAERLARLKELKPGRRP
jgi:hypothetical protein